MKKYPLIIMLARKGGPVTHQDAMKLVSSDPLLGFYFKPGQEVPVLVANVNPTPAGWGFCYIVVYGDIQLTPCIHARGLGFNDQGLGAPGDMATFLEGFPEIGYEGLDDPDFKHTETGLQSVMQITPDEMAQVMARFPSLNEAVFSAFAPPLNNRTLH